MAKTKGPPGVQNKVIYARASYLYQAANYLVNCTSSVPQDESKAQESQTKERCRKEATKQRKVLQNLSRRAICDMRAVTLKTQIRQSQGLKRTICKFCDTLQVEGQTCQSSVENLSKGGLKPWADVLVIRCGTCGNAKRFPVCGERQKRKGLRSPKSERKQDESTGGDAMEMDLTT
ncbi:hypothetical protein HIM_04953 [Hirsutella minnesotensis 3608]|uniref:Uncharacterized protein n=1 Tax=Hirsutella minnesotensis 3608 TaxID=1043627 RepID=A0A0F7ZKZ1_9HYPO|nr:hypothetical protein HIM_04953 [Hirsutella minnesotensis 3608]